MTDPLSNDTLQPYIDGSRVALVPFTREHLEHPAYLRWLNDLNTAKHLGIPSYVMPVARAELERYFLTNENSTNDVFFAVIEKSTTRFIGTLRVAHINWISRIGEIGIMIGAVEARGKGYANEMVELATRYAFQTLNLRKLVAGAHVENPASLKPFLRIGFKQEGLLKEQYFIDGHYIDLARLALFRRDWESSGSER